jgi:hypothetical protein
MKKKVQKEPRKFINELKGKILVFVKDNEEVEWGVLGLEHENHFDVDVNDGIGIIDKVELNKGLSKGTLRLK